MANCYKDKAGWRLVFTDHNRLRRTLRMGSMPRRDLEAIGRRVERLVDSRISGEPPDPETAHWLAKIGSKLRDKLVELNLCEPVEAKAKVTLGAFLTAYIDGRAKVKPGTRVNMEAAADALTEFFGSDKPVDGITAGDAEDWSQWLRGPRKLGENTSRRHSGRARQFFHLAVKKELVRVNPFADLKTRVQASDQSREHFCTREEAQAILEQCPNAEWRALIALSRFGGIRIPSESTVLRWEDIDWEKATIRITSPKTEHHAGHGARTIPLFPELRSALWELHEQLTEGEPAEFVFRRLRGKDSNMRTQLHRMMKRAGVPIFQKPFHNMRATRAIELSREWPAHVVEAWMGHTGAVARQHYLRVQPEDYLKAAAESGTNVAHNLPQRRATDGKLEAAPVVTLPTIAGNCTTLPSIAVQQYPRADSNC